MVKMSKIQISISSFKKKNKIFFFSKVFKNYNSIFPSLLSKHFELDNLLQIMFCTDSGKNKKTSNYFFQ